MARAVPFVPRRRIACAADRTSPPVESAGRAKLEVQLEVQR
jgi:hypothetical protein